MSTGPRLENERLRLRAMEVDIDTDHLYHWENDPDSWNSSGVLNPLSSTFIQEYIVQSSSSIIERGALALMIDSAEHGAVGYVQIMDYTPISKRAEVGIYLASEYRGMGYGREALQLVASYAWRSLGCRMLYARVSSSNMAAQRLFIALGYEHTATLPQWMWSDGQYHDLNYYQLWNRTQ